MNDPFLQRKQDVLDKLYKPDKSKKGDVDTVMIPIIDLINKHDDYYTTSSCSGRIMLFTDTASKNKADAIWHFVSHEQVNAGDILNNIDQITDRSSQNADMVWFRLESMILHVCARNLETAQKFLIFAQNNGYKHAALLAATKRFIIQIPAVEKLDVPIIYNKELVVSKEYIELLVDTANKKLAASHADLNRLKEAFEAEF